MVITPKMAEEAVATRMVALPAETLPLARCVGRILRQDVLPERDNPPFDRACMDGIAVSHEALARGLGSFRIQATQPAGTPALTLERDMDAIEVMTGAVMPRGTDCVIPLEEYELAGGVVTLGPGINGAPWRNVQRRGSDSPRDAAMLRAGTLLRAPEIAVAASAGLAQLSVSRQPRIIVISTGDELVEPGQPIAEHQVRRSNAPAIVAALELRGFGQVRADHLRDEGSELLARLAEHLTGNDALILSGGVSKGRFDLVPPVLKELGVEEVFHEIAQRPGRPMWFGMGPQGQAVFALPGNPVATMVCLMRYAVPALVRSMGQEVLQEPILLATQVQPHSRATSFLPVAVQHDEEGRLVGLPRPAGGSGDFLALTRADGFIALPPGKEPVPAGFRTELYRW
jgi:molybdopterin molybdotransferase